MKKFVAIALSLMMLLAVTAAGAEVLQIGFENSLSEPVGEGLLKWQELLAERNVGLTIELFPDSQLGAKNDLIDQMRQFPKAEERINQVESSEIAVFA